MDVSYYRNIGDSYAKIAAETTNPAAAVANSAEASKYYAIADRLEPLPEPGSAAASQPSPDVVPHREEEQS